jgi:hypothetical protein
MKPSKLQGSLEVLTQFQIVKRQKERDLSRKLPRSPGIPIYTKLMNVLLRYTSEQRTL